MDWPALLVSTAVGALWFARPALGRYWARQLAEPFPPCPVAALVAALERDRRAPLAWAVEWSGDGEPLARAWNHALDGGAMVRLLLLAEHTDAAARALEAPPSIALPLRPRLIDDWLQLRRTRALLAEAQLHARADDGVLARARLDQALAVFALSTLRNAYRRALADTVRAAIPAPPPLSEILARFTAPASRSP